MPIVETLFALDVLACVLIAWRLVMLTLAYRSPFTAAQELCREGGDLMSIPFRRERHAPAARSTRVPRDTP